MKLGYLHLSNEVNINYPFIRNLILVYLKWIYRMASSCYTIGLKLSIYQKISISFRFTINNKTALMVRNDRVF